MLAYCFVIDEEKGLVQLGAGCPDEYYIEIGMKKHKVKQSDINSQWYLYDKCPMKTKEQKEKEEKERVANLTCTKRVFVLMLQELGIDYFEQLLPVIQADKSALLEWELCVELLRKNPLLDAFASKFGLTHEKLDNLFKYANGEITLSEFKAGA